MLKQSVLILRKITRCVCETQMPPMMANSIDGQDHKDKYFDTVKRSCHKKWTCAKWKSNIFFFRNYNQCHLLKEKKVKRQGQKVSYHHKDLITRNDYVQYGSL